MSSSNTNVVSVTNTINGIVDLCIFCYKAVCHTSDQVQGDLKRECEQNANSIIIVQKFLKLLERFVGQEFLLFGEKNGLSLNYARKKLGCCEECRVIFSGFCETYEKLQCLEMELEWRLRTLVDIMKLASRVPSRNTQLRRVFEEEALEDGSDFEDCSSSPVDEGRKAEGRKAPVAVELESFRNFKHDLIKNCTARLSKSKPRVLVQRMIDTKNEDHLLSSTSVRIRSEGDCNMSSPMPYSGMEAFLGVIVSFASVVMLAFTTIDLQTSPDTTRSSHDGGEYVTACVPEIAASMSDVEDDGGCEEYDILEPEKYEVANGEQMDNAILTIQSPLRDYVAHVEGEMSTGSPSPVIRNLDYRWSQDKDDRVDDEKKIVNIQRPSKTAPNKTSIRKKIMMTRHCCSPIKLFRCGICNDSFQLYKSLRDHKTRSKRHQRLHKLLLERLQRDKSRKAREKKRESNRANRSNEVPTGKEITFQGQGDDREIILELPNIMKTEPVAEGSQERFDSDTLVQSEIPSTPIPQRYSLRSNQKQSYKLDEDDESDDSIDSDSSEESESSTSSEDETEKHVPPASPRQIRKKVDMRSTDPKEIMPKKEVFHESILLPIVPMTEGAEDNIETKYVVSEPSNSAIFIPTRKKLLCPIAKCELWFTTAQTLETHKMLHGNFSCNFCDIVKDYAPNLALHETRHTSADKIRKTATSKSRKVLHCSRCFRQYKRKEPFIMHFLKVHLNLSGACRTCPICSAESSNKTKFNMKDHFNSHHNTDGVDPSNILKCDQCPAYFLRSTHLLSHKYKIHLHEKCPECDKEQNRKKKNLEKLMGHMDQVHPEHNAFPHLIFRCKRERCRGRNRFATEQELVMHKKRYHDLPVQIVKCDKCEKQFNGFESLKNHMKYVHSSLTVVCSECGRAFKNTVFLQRHMTYHKGPDAWKFQCSTCGRKFADRQKLDQHMRTHTKEKPFVCQFCGTQYAHRHNWRNHVKAKHPDELAETEDVTATSSSAFGKGMSRKGSKKGDCILAGVRQT